MNLIGEIVFHKTFGKGTISSVVKDYFTVVMCLSVKESDSNSIFPTPSYEHIIICCHHFQYNLHEITM